jgi:hypothetical protein
MVIFIGFNPLILFMPELIPLILPIPPMLPIGFIPPIPIMFMGVVEAGGILARISLLFFMLIPRLPPMFMPMFMFIPS